MWQGQGQGQMNGEQEQWHEVEEEQGEDAKLRALLGGAARELEEAQVVGLRVGGSRGVGEEELAVYLGAGVKEPAFTLNRTCGCLLCVVL